MENLLLKRLLLAIQDEINQYNEGNLDEYMAINGIEELISSIHDDDDDDDE